MVKYIGNIKTICVGRHIVIRIAEKAASESVFKRARVGAVICKGGRVLSTGHNYIGHNRFVDRPYPESTHAEVSAISRLLKEKRLHDLVGASIYVVRLGRSGEVRLARPCASCHELIKAVGIKRIVYSIDSTQTGVMDV